MDIKICSNGVHGPIEFVVDQFGNHWLINLHKLNQEDLLSGLLDIVKEYKDMAIMVHLDIEHIYLLTILKKANVGFKYKYMSPDGSYIQWWIPNNSPMPDAYTSISSVFSVIINDKKEVLVIVDKNRPGISLPGGSVKLGELPHIANLRETKKEVGIIVNKSNLIASVYRVNSNRYGANDVMNYFLSTDYSGEMVIQNSQLLWGDFVPLDSILTKTDIFQDKKLSNLTAEILNHIINYPTERRTITTYDLRQNSKLSTNKDKSDTMTIELYPISSINTSKL